MLYLLGLGLVKAFVYITVHLEVKGRENIPHRDPLIVVANHASFMDPLLILAIMDRRVKFMAKRELFRTPVLRNLVGIFAFPVDRSRADLAAIKQARRVLKEGKALVMFPEGSRSRNGKLQPAMPGVALFALWTKAKVLPIGIAGTKDIQGWKWIFRRPRVEVSIGRAYEPESAGEGGQGELARYAHQMMQQLALLLPQSLRGYYDKYHDN